MKRAMQHTLGENECPTGLASCPSSYGGGLECVNMLEELDHCGACGNNCLALPGIISTGVSVSFLQFPDMQALTDHPLKTFFAVLSSHCY